KKDLEDKIRVVRLLTSPERRAASVHILDDLSASTPEQLWLTEFAEAKGVAKISGKAVDNQTIAAFARNLSGSRYFQKVEIRETSQEAPPAVDPRNRPGAGKPLPVDSPPAVSMTKFLIEVSLNYTLSMGGAGAPEGKEEGKGQKAGGSKPAKKTGAGEG
ncbi:MAG: PilN domain-containing protein, partial [Deltaproteobacteria bacterium]|nr:PilN domain-containing protein [Deltaproteobacteria bacterium]